VTAVLGLARPPRWGIVTLVALVLVNAALLTYLALRPTPSDPLAGRTPAPAAQTSDVIPPATATSSAPPAPMTPPVLAVVGDGYSTGSALGGQGAAGWPALVAQELGAQLRLNAVSMAGYAAVGTTGQDFSGITAASPVPDAAVTIVFGSRNDLGESVAAVAEGATETLELIRSSAPGTQLVVVGPAWSSAQVPDAIYPVRDAVEAAAEAAGATFVDPLKEGWFSQPATLVAPDGISPTDAGHAFLASRIAPAVQATLSAVRPD
jgi:lysophospholipase L1-like esterase